VRINRKIIQNLKQNCFKKKEARKEEWKKVVIQKYYAAMDGICVTLVQVESYNSGLVDETIVQSFL